MQDKGSATEVSKNAEILKMKAKRVSERKVKSYMTRKSLIKSNMSSSLQTNESS